MRFGFIGWIFKVSENGTIERCRYKCMIMILVVGNWGTVDLFTLRVTEDRSYV